MLLRSYQIQFMANHQCKVIYHAMDMNHERMEIDFKIDSVVLQQGISSVRREQVENSVERSSKNKQPPHHTVLEVRYRRLAIKELLAAHHIEYEFPQLDPRLNFSLQQVFQGGWSVVAHYLVI